MTETTRKSPQVFGAGTLLRGNFTPKKAIAPNLSAPVRTNTAERSMTDEFERRARERIGGSIAFVSRITDDRKDPLFWDGDDDGD